MSRIYGNRATSKGFISAPKCRKIKFDPPFDAPGSELSSARRINILRQTHEAMATILWKPLQICDFHLNSVGQDLRFLAIFGLQNPPCRPQSVGFQSLTHHWMRQGQGFPAHVELISYDKHSSVWLLICRNRHENSKTNLNFANLTVGKGRPVSQQKKFCWNYFPLWDLHFFWFNDPFSGGSLFCWPYPNGDDRKSFSWRSWTKNLFCLKEPL